MLLTFLSIYNAFLISVELCTVELYTVEFNIIPPTNIELSLHKDWLDKYGSQLMTNQYFLYEDVNFEEIAKASRR